MKTLHAVAVLASLLFPLNALASSVTVPDDHSTIPAAIASGADTIIVRDGDYPAPISITRPLAILPATNSGYYGNLAYPSVGSIAISGSLSATVVIRHLRAKGAVTWSSSSGVVTVDGCRLDMGLTTSGDPFSAIQLHGCIVRGNVALVLYYPEVVGCTFLQSSLTVHSNGSAIIRDNYFVGPAPFALQMGSYDASWNVSENLIVGTTIGILVHAGTVRNNEIRDVTGTALVADGTFGARFLDNVVIRPGGHGIDVASVQFGNVEIRGNRVEDAGLDGIRAADGAWTVRSNVVLRAGGHGLVVGTGGAVHSNTVIAAGGTGIVTSSPAVVDSNVVGRSVDDGIVVTGADASLVFSYNTSYLNGGNGLDLSGDGGFALTHNIGFGNVGRGLDWAGSGQPVLACNDWFSNLAGASNIAVGSTDLAVHPMFCDLPNDDVHLSASSTLVNAPGCGQVGALGSGCGGPVSVGSTGSPGGFEAFPQPARSLVKFAFGASGETRHLAIYDLSGALRWSARVPGGSTGWEWHANDGEGRALPAGIYFAKLTDGRAAQRARVVLIQ